MKYVLIDERSNDLFTQEFETIEEAKKQGEKEASYLTESDKCLNLYVMESANPDEEAENHLDGDPVKFFIKDGKKI